MEPWIRCVICDELHPSNAASCKHSDDEWRAYKERMSKTGREDGNNRATRRAAKRK